MPATIPTINGGSDHEHIGMILVEMEYMVFSTSYKPFVVPQNPSLFPTAVITNEVDCLQQIAENKHLIIKYETYKNCLQATHPRSARPPTQNDLPVGTANY